MHLISLAEKCNTGHRREATNLVCIYWFWRQLSSADESEQDREVTKASKRHQPSCRDRCDSVEQMQTQVGKRSSCIEMPPSHDICRDNKEILRLPQSAVEWQIVFFLIKHKGEKHNTWHYVWYLYLNFRAKLSVLSDCSRWCSWVTQEWVRPPSSSATARDTQTRK